MEDSLIKTKNITYDRFVFFSSKQQKWESVESSYGRLSEQAENCSLGDEETTLMRDTFILNIQDQDTQRELLKKTGSPTKAIEVVIHREMGPQNQQKNNQNLNTSAQSVNIVNNFQGRNRNANYQQPRKDFTRFHTLKTTHIQASALFVVSARVKTINKFAPQIVRNAIIVELLDILQKKVPQT